MANIQCQVAIKVLKVAIKHQVLSIIAGKVAIKIFTKSQLANKQMKVSIKHMKVAIKLGKVSNKHGLYFFKPPSQCNTKENEE